jgi:hypothetical protein
MEPLAASNQPLGLVAETRPNVFPDIVAPTNPEYQTTKESDHVKGCVKCQKRLNKFRELEAPYSIYSMAVKHANQVHEQDLLHPEDRPEQGEIGSNGKDYITSTAPNGDTYCFEIPPSSQPDIEAQKKQAAEGKEITGPTLPPQIKFPKKVKGPSSVKGKEAHYYQWLEDLKNDLYGDS